MTFVHKIIFAICTKFKKTPCPTYGYVVRPFTDAEAAAFAEWREHMARD
jgi:hypothetical protein